MVNMAVEQPMTAAETGNEIMTSYTVDDWLVLILRRPQLIHELRHTDA